MKNLWHDHDDLTIDDDAKTATHTHELDGSNVEHTHWRDGGVEVFGARHKRPKTPATGGDDGALEVADLTADSASST